MKMNKIDIGHWVEFYHKSTEQMLLGFVISIGRFDVNVYVPKKEKVYIIPIIKVASREDVVLEQQDIHTLINIALDRRDFVWLTNLVASRNKKTRPL